MGYSSVGFGFFFMILVVDGYAHPLRNCISNNFYSKVKNIASTISIKIISLYLSEEVFRFTKTLSINLYSLASLADK